MFRIPDSKFIIRKSVGLPFSRNLVSFFRFRLEKRATLCADPVASAREGIKRIVYLIGPAELRKMKKFGLENLRWIKGVVQFSIYWVWNEIRDVYAGRVTGRGATLWRRMSHSSFFAHSAHFKMYQPPIKLQ